MPSSPPLAHRSGATTAMRTGGPLLAASACFAFAALAVALFTQHALDMQPCSWCVVQRMAMLVAGAACALGAALHRAPVASRLLAAVALAAGAAGLAAAVWQQGWASKSLSCAYTLADRIVSRTGLGEALPAVFQPTATCAEANQSLLGVPYAVWSAMAFALIVVAAAAALWRSGRAAP